MIRADAAIRRFRRDLTFSRLLRWLFAGLFLGTLLLPVLRVRLDPLMVMPVIACVFLVLSFGSVRGSRLVQESPSLIASGQFEEAERLGIVRMRPAFSRAPQNGARYVQDRIAADADEVWELLGDPAKNTHVYICGDGAKMAPAVRRVFLDIYRARTGSDESQARDWLVGLVESDHYVEDVWAG